MAAHPPPRQRYSPDPAVTGGGVRGGPAGLLLVGLVGMGGGVVLEVSDVVGGGMLVAAGLVLVVLSCVAAAVWTAAEARRFGQPVGRTFAQSVRAFGRWCAFLL